MVSKIVLGHIIAPWTIASRSAVGQFCLLISCGSQRHRLDVAVDQHVLRAPVRGDIIGWTAMDDQARVGPGEEIILS
jgi:hypothetical protein